MGQLLVKPGVRFGTKPAYGGARILEVLKRLVESYTFNVTITSANDGVHSGPSDPHFDDEAYDVRTHTLTDEQKRLLLNDLRNGLYREPRRFYVVLESPGGSNEHIHCQVRKGTTYTALDYLQNL